MSPTEAAMFSDIATGVATSVMAILAAIGLTTWRTQLAGTADYELARRVLRSVFRVRDEIARMRSPLLSGGETSTAVAAAGEKLPDDFESASRRSYELAYDARWRRLTEVLSDFEVELVEAEVLWGKSTEAHAKRMRKAVARLSIAIRSHLRSRRHEPRTDKERKHLADHELVLWSGGDENGVDAFGDEVSALVAEFESFLRPKFPH